MPKEDAIELEGVVREVLPSAMFRVELPGGHDILATRSEEHTSELQSQ